MLAYFIFHPFKFLNRLTFGWKQFGTAPYCSLKYFQPKIEPSSRKRMLKLHPGVKRLVRRIEQIKDRIDITYLPILFKQTCLKEEMLSKYIQGVSK